MSQPQKIGRRRFLKHIGAGAVAVGASAAGGYGYYQYYYGRQPPKPTPTITQTVSPTPTTPSPTPTPTKLYSLEGRLFFDYNGNGMQDGEEPAVANAKVLLKDNVKNIDKVIAETTTDSSVYYKLDVPNGNYRLFVETDKKFRHMCRSAEEFRLVKYGYDIELNEPKEVNIGMMEGIFTLPYPRKAKILRTLYYFDVDKRNYYTRDWKGGNETYDQHPGTDYSMPISEDIVAAAPGRVNYTMEGQGEKVEGMVLIWHGEVDPFGNSFYSLYGHISKVYRYIGEAVKRGDKIAESGYTGPTRGEEPHLHWSIGGRYESSWIDPYRDVSNPESISYWTVDNKPQYPGA